MLSTVVTVGDDTGAEVAVAVAVSVGDDTVAVTTVYEGTVPVTTVTVGDDTVTEPTLTVGDDTVAVVGVGRVHVGCVQVGGIHVGGVHLGGDRRVVGRQKWGSSVGAGRSVRSRSTPAEPSPLPEVKRIVGVGASSSFMQVAPTQVATPISMRAVLAV